MAANYNDCITKEVQLAITAGAYAAGDVVGGLITVDIGASGIIRQLKLVDDDNIGAALDLYIFNAEPTAIADNAVFATAFTLADHKKWIARLSITTADWNTINSNKTAFATYLANRNLAIDYYSGNGKFYVYIVTPTGSTPTYVSTSGLLLYATVWKNNSG